MIGRGLRAAVLILGVAVVALTALPVLPFDEAFEERPAPEGTSLPPGVIVEEAPPSPYVDRGGSDVHGHADDDWREVALAFASVLSSYDGDQQAWHGRLIGLVTPALAEGYRHTDPGLLSTQSPNRVLAWSQDPWGRRGGVGGERRHRLAGEA